MGNPWEIGLVIGYLSLWILFPVGVFLSEAKLDKNSDQLFQFHKSHGPGSIRSIHKVKERPGFKGKHWDFTFGRGLGV